LCRPAGGEPHRFTELLPRREADRSVCRSCFTRLEPCEGQPGPRDYSFTAQEVAHLLVRVAEGSTYRSAAQAVRRLAGRPEASRDPRSGRRRSLSEGQLAANWVDCFADVVTSTDPPLGWPSIVVLDSLGFEVVSGANAGRRFQVLGAVGHRRRGAPQRVVLLEPAPQKSQAEWKAFSCSVAGRARCGGQRHGQRDRPRRRGAVPRGGATLVRVPPQAQRALPEGVAVDRSHTVTQALEFAFTAVPNYAAFERAVKAAAATEPGFKGALKWLDRHGPRVVAQAGTTTLTGPNSTGGCEATLGQISRRLADRTGRMTNRARLRRLLALMAAEINGAADQQAWTERIQEALLAAGGRPMPQRHHDDPSGYSSLLGPPTGSKTAPPTRSTRAEIDPRRGRTCVLSAPNVILRQKKAAGQGLEPRFRGPEPRELPIIRPRREVVEDSGEADDGPGPGAPERAARGDAGEGDGAVGPRAPGRTDSAPSGRHADNRFVPRSQARRSAVAKVRAAGRLAGDPAFL
jgi:hypothetical protein